eukprot:UN00920
MRNQRKERQTATVYILKAHTVQLCTKNKDKQQQQFTS